MFSERIAGKKQERAKKIRKKDRNKRKCNKIHHERQKEELVECRAVLKDENRTKEERNSEGEEKQEKRKFLSIRNRVIVMVYD